MKTRFFVFLFLILNMVGQINAEKRAPYKDKSLPIETRVEDLLSRMTLEEKVGQLLCTLGWDYYNIKGSDVDVSEKFVSEYKEKQMGSLWATFRADPWTRKTLSNGLNPELAAKAANALQRYAVEKTRLGIPLFLAEEAPHGHMAIGTTVFPTGLGLAATWSEDLAEQMGRVVAKEIRLQGAHISYGPVIDLAREPRWSRVEETFGEDAILTAKLASAEVKGLGGGMIDTPFATISTLKHFIAYGIPEGGQNGAQSVVGWRDINDNFLPPFREAIKSGALSVMTAYNSLDGIPNSANSYLLKDILRTDWQFNGLVVSDLYSINVMHNTLHTAATLQEAAIKALTSGVDIDLGGIAYMELIQAVKDRKLNESVVNDAVRRVLRMKFEMGLFENPYVDPTKARQVRSLENIQTALNVARASITLLKNNGILPLKKDAKIALVGPNADNRYNMLGDYTAPQANENIVTVLDALQKKLPEANINYVKGCAIRDTSRNNIAEAVDAARQSDVIIAVVGGSSARDFKTSYKETGAAEVENMQAISDMESGEGYDRASLSLLGLQQKLLQELKATGKSLVVVYIEGRPLEKNWADANADAILTAYYPGQQGGNAIADVLFGDYNPAGRLPISVPRSVGQLPVYYNHPLPQKHNYVETEATPLYPFGYGLSYTHFDYSNLHVDKERLTVSVDVTNSGNYDGEEVVQLYISDVVASTVQPIRQLKDFCRTMIKKGETKHIEFKMQPEQFAITAADMKRKVEAGDFLIQIGTSSDDIRLSEKITFNKDINP